MPGLHVAQEIIDIFYPIGSVYISANNSINPNTQFGGTWIKIEGRFLIGTGTGNDGDVSRTFTLGQNGGSYRHRHPLGYNGAAGIRNIGDTTYLLGSDSIPVNNLWQSGLSSQDPELGKVWKWTHNSDVRDYDVKNYKGVPLYGNTELQQFVPPYEAVNIWKRTA